VRLKPPQIIETFKQRVAAARYHFCCAVSGSIRVHLQSCGNIPSGPKMFYSTFTGGSQATNSLRRG